MPLAPVDNNGTVLHYEDSGIPTDSANYTTLVLVHGIQFHAGIFKRMIPYAAANNLRLILLNMKDNGQSTKFTEAELKQINSGDRNAQISFLKNCAFELAVFLSWLIQQEKIPEVQDVDGKRVGGLSVVAWSSANLYLISFFAFAEDLPIDQKVLIEKYFRSFIAYDVAQLAVGVPNAPLDELYNALLDPKVPTEEKMAAWIPKLVGHCSKQAAYVKQAFSATTLSEFPARVEFLSHLQTTPDPVTYDLTELGPAMEMEGLTTAQAILGFDLSIYRDSLAKFLTSNAFSKTKIECVSLLESLPEVVYGVYYVKQQVLERKEAGLENETRKVEFRLVDGAGHAWHWEEPEATTKLFAQIA